MSVADTAKIEVVPPAAVEAAQKLFEDGIAKIQDTNIEDKEIVLAAMSAMKGTLDAISIKIDKGQEVFTAQLSTLQVEALRTGEKGKARGFFERLDRAIHKSKFRDKPAEPNRTEPSGGGEAGAGGGGA